MGEQESVRVGLADFQFLTRKALAGLIGELPGFHLAAETENASQLLKAINRDIPHVLVIDLKERNQEMIEEILSLNAHPNFQVLIVTNSNDHGLLHSLLRRGIRGMITKNCSESEIVNALRAVAIGNRFFCSNVLEIVMEADEQKKPADSPLSDREQQVLTLIAEGKSTQEIADNLHISVHTVNSHRKNIIKKLNITSPVHLVAYAVEAGLVKVSFD